MDLKSSKINTEKIKTDIQGLLHAYVAPIITEFSIATTQGGQSAPLESSSGFLSS